MSRWKKGIRLFFLSLGVLFFLLLINAFTTLPFWMLHGLGSSGSAFRFVPHSIVLLGGGGMPSEQNLLRIHYAARLHQRYPKCDLVVCIPEDTAIRQTSRQAWMQIRRELILQGVDSNHISVEKNGRNTHEQANRVLEMYKTGSKALLLVTSPEHMYRSVLAFKKAGFEWVGGVAAFEQPLSSDLQIESDLHSSITRRMLEQVGNNPQFRYQFWNHLKYQVICFREYAAIAYYWLRGWI